MRIDPETKAAIAELVQACRDVVAGKIEFVEGVRSIHALMYRVADPNAEDPILDGIRGLESELDAYPTGELRKQYVPAYLAELDSRLKTYQASEEPLFRSECERLIERYAPLAELDPDTYGDTYEHRVFDDIVKIARDIVDGRTPIDSAIARMDELTYRLELQDHPLFVPIHVLKAQADAGAALPTATAIEACEQIIKKKNDQEKNG